MKRSPTQTIFPTRPDDGDDLLDIFEDGGQMTVKREILDFHLELPVSDRYGRMPLTGTIYERYFYGHAMALGYDAVIGVDISEDVHLSVSVDRDLWHRVLKYIHIVNPPIGHDDERQTVAIFFNVPLSRKTLIQYESGTVALGIAPVTLDTSWLLAFFCVAARMVLEFSDYFQAAAHVLEKFARTSTTPSQEFLLAYCPPLKMGDCHVYELQAFQQPEQDVAEADLRLYVTNTDEHAFKAIKTALMTALHRASRRNTH